MTEAGENLTQSFDLTKVTIHPDSVLFEQEEGLGRYVFHTETMIEGRKIGYEIGKSVIKQRARGDFKEGEEESFLSLLTNPEPFDSCRLDGAQLVFFQKYDRESKTWRSYVIEGYAKEGSDEVTRLEQAIKEVGFTDTPEHTE